MTFIIQDRNVWTCGHDRRFQVFLFRKYKITAADETLLPLPKWLLTSSSSLKWEYLFLWKKTLSSCGGILWIYSKSSSINRWIWELLYYKGQSKGKANCGSPSLFSVPARKTAWCYWSYVRLKRNQTEVQYELWLNLRQNKETTALKMTSVIQVKQLQYCGAAVIMSACGKSTTDPGDLSIKATL